MPWPDLVSKACGIGRSGGNPQDETPTRRKTPLWGPSIAAQASDDDSEDMINPQIVTEVQNNNVDKKQEQQQQQNRSLLSSFITDSPVCSRKDTSAGSGNTNPNQDSNSSSISNSPQHSTQAVTHEDDAAMDRLWQQTVGNFWTSSSAYDSQQQSYAEPFNRLSDIVHDACTSSPCSPRNLAKELYPSDTEDGDEGGLGISPLQGPNASPAEQAAAQKAITCQQMERTHEEIEVSTSHHIQVRLPPQDGTVAAVVDMATNCGTANIGHNNNNNNNGKTRKKRSSKKKKDAAPTKIPLQTLEVKTDEAVALERSISELTMRSSYAAAHAAANSNNNISANNNNNDTSALPQVPDKSRRMAYYAVGKHHRNAGRGGNRRCYFTGKLILGGAPFYAGSVQQGLRTLVVFCLPSAVGLPDKDALLKYSLTANEMKNSGSSSGKGHRRIGSRNGTILSVQPVNGRTGSIKSASNRSAAASVPLQMDTSRGLLLRGTGRSCAASVASKSMTSKVSRLSSLDDMSLSIEGDLDPNWGLDRDVLLAVLPSAGPDLLKQMADHYPEQFETLPMQVREPTVWKLYVKFCFFSGLPIAEGELHYKVVDDIAEQVYGEEIALSHDVMEAATGKSSAEILALPNRIVLNYIRKHYPQQCSKLEDRVFVRSSWERVSPEV